MSTAPITTGTNASTTTNQRALIAEPTLETITATTAGFILWIIHHPHVEPRRITAYARQQIQNRTSWDKAPQEVQNTARACGILYSHIDTTYEDAGRARSAVTFTYNTSP